MNNLKKNNSRDFETNQKMTTMSKNVISKVKYVLLALSMVFALSCNPEDGEMGPEGPAGQDGNANVTSITLRDQSILPKASIILDVPILTQEIFDKGFVFAYINDSDNLEQWRSLPIAQSNGSLHISRIQVGKVEIGNSFNSSFVIDIRIVIIEGN